MCGSHLCGDEAIRTPNQGLSPFALLLRLITPYFSRTVLSTMCTFRKSKALQCASPYLPVYFRAANIMNRHVITVICHLILWKSTSIDTLWTYMGFYHTLSIYYSLPYIGRSHNDLKFSKVVRSLIQDRGGNGNRTRNRMIFYAARLFTSILLHR